MASLKFVLGFAAAMVFVGVASDVQAQTHRTPAEARAQQYAAALQEAFEAYETDVGAALRRTYASSHEAEAVSLSFSARRFDALLQLALRKRQLTVDGLGRFAATHADFARAQEELYRGRLARIEQAAGRIGQRVAAAMTASEGAAHASLVRPVR